jgi:hypothetical protein
VPISVKFLIRPRTALALPAALVGMSGTLPTALAPSDRELLGAASFLGVLLLVKTFVYVL